ncbi:MAG: tRNA (adenine-N1)-methyltransferase [Euryarchaeota archaeon]|nr:tRNA (adenine-N1)-methyltransferase [Euryarchaeota archaeon]
MYTLIGNKKKYIAFRDGEMFRVGDFAVLKSLKPGKIKLGLQEYYVVKSTLHDYMSTIARKPQIISMKDAAYIIARCSVRNGTKVIEAGVGSGSLTTALLYFTYPDGRVITYETRKDHAEFAKENIKRMPHEHWTLKIGDVRTDVSEKDMDAFILDIPEPWEAVEMASKVLAPGGCFAAYVPTYNQMEKTHRTLKDYGFGDMEACEIIKRDMYVGPMGTRPENVEVAHTGFMVFARKLHD